MTYFNTSVAVKERRDTEIKIISTLKIFHIIVLFPPKNSRSPSDLKLAKTTSVYKKVNNFKAIDQQVSH